MRELASERTADGVAGLFEPDFVLPSQFYDLSAAGLKGGERRLMAAILSDGIEAYINSIEADGSDEHSEAQSWVETRDTAYVFSFDVVCESLGIDAEYLRLGLRRYVLALRNRQKQWKRIRRPRK